MSEERITYDEFMTMFKFAPKMCYTLYDKAEDEIDRLNNIINELEKWLDKKEKLTFNSWNKGIHEVQIKLQELKENK